MEPLSEKYWYPFLFWDVVFFNKKTKISYKNCQKLGNHFFSQEVDPGLYAGRFP